VNRATVVAVQATISDVLRTSGPVPVSAEFHELGGTSLLAAVILAKLWREFGVRLELSDLSPHTSASALAESIDRKRSSAR
jgi:acyl carrier protein